MILNIIEKIQRALKSKGLFGLLKFASMRVITMLIGFPIALIIVAASPFIAIRLVKLFSYRIGHYAHNTELLLCALDAKRYDKHKNYKTLFYISNYGPISNTQLHIMWKRVITILPFALLWNQVDDFLKIMLGETYRDDPIKLIFETSSGGHDQWRFLEKNKECRLSFTVAEKNRGLSLLHKLGIEANTPFVCLLMRDSGYLKTHMPDVDWSYHNYRDVDVNNYKKVAILLAEKGYHVIRMGKFVKEKFYADHPNIVDYSDSEFQSDFMDIYLTAHCKFMISTSCGLDSVAQIFRKPVLITDFPLSELKTWYYWTMFIFKKVFDANNNRYLTLSEIYQQRELFNNKTLMIKTWNENNWHFIDNSPEEIVEATEEMIFRLQNSVDEDIYLQNQFWNNFPIELPEGVTSYEEIKLRIGKSFLKNNQLLLN